MLPLGSLDELECVAVRHRYVLAHELDVVNWLLQVIMDVLLNCEHCLLLVCHLQLPGQLRHLQVLVLVRERQKLKLNVCSFRLLGHGITWPSLDQYIGVELTLGHSTLVGLVEQDALELVIALFKVRNQPVYNVL